jgi:tetratricopeptide (TPR) repeat protein
MARKTTELDSDPTPAKPPEGKTGRSLGDLLQSAAQIMVSSFLVLVVIAIFARLVADKRNPPILIDAFGVPKTLEDRGYTGQVVASEVGEEIARIERTTRTSASKQDVTSASAESLAPIQIPETGLSLDVIIDFLEDFLHIAPRHLSGELTFEDNNESPYVAGSDSGLRGVVITVRVTGMEGRGKSVDAMIRSPDEAISQAAREALELIDPYVLAVYYYDIQRDPETTLQLTSECEGESIKWARTLEGIVLEGEGDYPGALAKYQEALELDPKFAPAYGGWGAVLYDQHEYVSAAAKHQVAVELDPNYAAAYIGWGSALYAQHDYPGAAAKYQRAADLQPDADVYYNWANALEEQHDFADAIAKYQKAVELDPKFAPAYKGWGVVLYDQRDYQGAIAKYQNAIELRPKYADAYDNWGRSLRAQKDYAGAIAEYQKAIELNANFSPAYTGWGDVLDDQHDYVGAIAKYQKASELDPGNDEAYYDWGVALYQQHDYPEAIEKLQKAVDLDPQDQLYRSNLAAARKAQAQAK